LRPRCVPQARRVPQWIGTAMRGWISATASAARMGSKCLGTRGVRVVVVDAEDHPQRQAGCRHHQRRPERGPE
jgi:hypothetical protein